MDNDPTLRWYVAMRWAQPGSSYPFCRLTGPANILVMPGLHSAHITSRLAPRLGGGGTIGALLIGLTHAVQLIPMESSVSQILDIATIAAHQAIKA